MSMTQEARDEATRLLRNGQKIEALKYLANTYGVTLQESKQLLEALELELFGQSLEVPEDNQEPLTHDTNVFQLDDRKEIEDMLRTTSKIEVVKWVKTKHNIGLKEALRKVEAIEKANNPNAKFVEETGSNVFKIVGSIFSLVGFILLGVGGFIYYLDKDIVQDQNKSQGIVTDLVEMGNMSAPIITYTWQGKEYNYKSTSYSYPPAFDYTEEVALYVNPANPTEVVIDTFSERWLAITIVGGIGIVFAGLGLIFVFVSRRF